MTLLYDSLILEARDEGRLSLEPFFREAVQPCSIDLHLDPAYRRIDFKGAVDMANLDFEHSTLYENEEHAPITVNPGEPVLMSTLETVTLDSSLAAQVDGKSSIGRLFQSVHITAGWIDAGFSGQITLEVINHLSVPVIYYPFAPIAQLVVFSLDSDVANPYSAKGHYQGQRGPVSSRYQIPNYVLRGK